MNYQNISKQAISKTIHLGIEAIFSKYREGNTLIYGCGAPKMFKDIIDVSYSGKYLRNSKRKVPKKPMSIDYTNPPNINIIVLEQEFEEEANKLAKFLDEAIPEINSNNIHIQRGYVPETVIDIARKYIKK